MPSFDIVSEVDMHELTNAIDQANREVGTRFDFKGTDAKFESPDASSIVLGAQVEFQIQQMLEILKTKLVKRGISIQSLKEGEVEITGQRAIMRVQVLQGIEADIARRVVKLIKESKLKVQVAIQGDKLRVTGKKRDDLQEAIGLLRESNLSIPLQFNNFRE